MTQTPVEQVQVPGSRLEARRLARARARQRRRRAAVIGLFLATVVLIGAAFARAAGSPRKEAPAAAPTAGPTAAPTVDPTAEPPPAAATWPEEGSGEWRYAPGQEAVFGGEGDLLRFRVAVEADLDVSPDEFAAAVDAILADPRGWTAAEHRFQRVGEGDDSDFTIYLATPATSEELCAEAGIHTDRYTSCRIPGEVYINVARWLTAVPGYPLEEYRAFAINHEVGHELDAVHRGCPRPGEPAPVMMPQTLTLDGCTPYGWPFLDGERYNGPRVP